MHLLVDGRCLLTKPASGVTHLVQELLPALFTAHKNDEITLFTSSWRPPAELGLGSLPANVHHVHRKIPSKVDNLAYFTNLQQLDQKIDRLHHVFLPTIDFTGRLSVPYSLLIHDLSFLVEPSWFSTKSRLWHRFIEAERLISGASALFAVSEYTKRELIRLLSLPEERIQVIPVGLSHPERKGYSSSISAPYLLALAGQDERKNIGVAIEAWNIVRKIRPHLKLIITTQNNSSSADPDLVFLRYPDRDQLQALMAHAELLLYPSWYEGFGLPLHEAAALGVPCIASITTALPETAPSGTRFVPPTKPHLWALSIQETLNHRHSIDAPARSWLPAAQIIQHTIQALCLK